MFRINRSSRNVLASFLMAALCAGCATGGGASAPLRMVQAVQVGDDALDCSSLTNEIATADAAVATLTREIDSTKTMAWANQAVRMVNTQMGQNNLFGDMLAGKMTGSLEDKREIRDSFQRRRDVLLQQHMHKQCAHQAHVSSAPR